MKKSKQGRSLQAAFRSFAGTFLAAPSFLPTTFSAVFAAVLFCAGTVRAEDVATGPLGFGTPWIPEDMETDRPDFTEGTQTIAPGHLQLEAGYTFVFDKEDSLEVRQHALPESLLRIGVMEDLELRLAWSGYIYQSVSPGDDVEGAGDTSIGFKHRMYDAELARPDISMILELGLPTGDEELSSDEAEPSFKLLWSYDIPKIAEVGGNLNFNGPVEAGSRYFEFSPSLAVAYPLGAATSVYGEYFAIFPGPDAPDMSTENYLNGGFTYLVEDNLQLDARIGFGLNDAAADLFCGVGISYRI